MKFPFIYLFLLLSVASCTPSNQLINAMKQQAEKIAKTMPKDYSKLVDDIKTDGLDGYNECAENDFDEMMKQYSFQSSINGQFKMATISQSVEFQAFQVSVKNTYSDIQEFIGAALKYNGTIKIAFLQVFAEGTPVIQYESYKCCHKCWLVGSCCDTCKRKIGMTSDQLDVITDALRATAYEKVTNFLANPPQDFANYTQEQQKLQDQNKWDVEMSKYAHCKLGKEKYCLKYLKAASKTCKKSISNNHDDDEQIQCLLEALDIAKQSDLIPCYLCLCARYEHKQDYPITEEFCYNNYFSSVQ